MTGIRHYFAVICKAFDSFYICWRIQKLPLLHFFSFSSNLFIQEPSLSVLPIDAMRDTRFGAMECRALFRSGKDARNVDSGVEKFQ